MRLKLILAGVLLLGATNVATAQKKKDCPEGATLEDGKCEYRRKSDVKVNVKVNDRTRPLVANEESKDEGPTLSADEILEVEGAVGDIREDQIELLQALIDETPDSEVDEKADLYFRLAEAHAQQHRYWRLKTQEMAIKADGTKKKADKEKYKKESEDDAKKAKEALLKAVDAYKKLAANDAFKDYSNMDKALFKFGYMLQSGRYMKEARSVYQRLIKEYPDSPYIPDAKVAFGDYYFEMAGTEPDKFKEHLENAEEEYKAVLQFPKSQVYTYAMYKIGWVYLNLAQHTDAFEVFFKVAELTKGDKKKETLNKAAKKDLVRAYAEMGKADMAYKTFQRVDKKYAFDMLQILGDLYLDKGKGEKAIYTFRELMSLDGKHKNVCLWQYNIAHAMLTDGTNKQKVEEIENLVNLYGALKEKKVLPAAEAEECHDNAAAMYSDLARAYHNESMKTLNTDTLQYADRLYKVYLDKFPDAEDYGETEYYYAELLWSRAENEKNQRLQTELWENAAVEFTDVVKHGKVEDKLMKEAAFAAVLGWKNALAVDPRVKPPAVNPKDSEKELPAPKEIPERELKMLDAFDVYIKYIKDAKDTELVGMKFLKANIYRKYNHFDEAIPIFEDILENHRNHETALYSANLLLDTLNRQHKFEEMIVWVDKLLADEKFLKDKDELKELLENLKITSMRKAVEEVEKKAKDTKDFTEYVKCGEMYIDLFNRNPDAEDAHEILYNAGVCFEEGKSIGTAIQMFELLSANYPKANETQLAIARLGLNYGRIAWYRESATKFEEYAKKYAGMDQKKATSLGLPTAYDAMSNAVFYRKGIGDDEKAIADTKMFIATFAKGKGKLDDASNAAFSLTTIYEKQGDKDKIVSHLRKYIKDYGSASAARVVVAYTKIGQILWDQSCKVKLVNGSCIKVSRERAVRSAGNKKKKKGKKTVVKKYCNATDEDPKVPSTPRVTVIDRDEKLVKEANTAFKGAIAAYEKAAKGGKGLGDEDAQARYYYARAKFLLADQKFESFLSVRFPAGLDFNPKNATIMKKSIKRFDDWYKEKNTSAEAAVKAFAPLYSGEEIIDYTWAIAASARVGQITQNFTGAFYAAEVPEEQRKQTASWPADSDDDTPWDVYCDTLSEKAAPLENESIAKFTACLSVSTKLGWFNEWSKMCEYELGQINPAQFPTASEIRAEPDELAPITVVEDAILKLPDEEMTMKTNTIIRTLLIGLLGVIAACGPKSVGGTHKKCPKGDKTCTADVPDVCLPGDPCYKAPPKCDKKEGCDTVVSVDARKDFDVAVAFYNDAEAKGWDAGSCKAAADKFAAVAREHQFVEAQYMVGRSYHNCNMLGEAEAAYTAALQIKSDHAPSISNLGELYYQSGKREGAKKYWEAAVKADPKIVAARANLAMLLLEDLRVTTDPAKWKAMEQEARDHLSSVLAVNNDHLKAYVLYGLIYMEGRDKNKNRLDLAKLLLDEGTKRLKEGQKFAPLEHAYGLYYLYKANLTKAMEHFQAAVDIDPNFAEAHENVALINLGYRKYDNAKEHFQKVLDLSENKNYDALIGLGIADRGLNDLDGAEANYNAALKVDSKRGEASFNLGVLYKDFRASNAADNKASLESFKKAKEFFKDAVSKTLLPDDMQEAKDNITDCDKSIKVYEDAIKISASSGDAG